MSAITDAFLRPLIRYRGNRPYIDLTGTAKKLKPEIPPAEHVLLTHTAGQNDIRVTYPDGQTELFYMGPDIKRLLASRNIPEEKIERVLDYLWNFYEVYIDCETDPKPPSLPE